MTNVWRALGWDYGMMVLMLDLLKGLIPVQLLAVCLGSLPPEYGITAGMEPPLLMGTGLAAILGHTFTPWLKFKGGKGVATGGGVLLGLLGGWLLIPIGLMALVILITRYVSLGSILAGLTVAGLTLAVPQLRQWWPLGVLTALIVLATHRGNIRRLLSGTENKLGRAKQQ
jgi:glycerol-3-phosphate acyltransferase PlsY